MRAMRAWAVAATATLLTGCGEGGTTMTTTITTTVTATPTATSSSTSPSASSSSTPSESNGATDNGPLALGKTWTHPSGQVTFQVQKYDSSIDAGFGVLAGILVRACVKTVDPGEKGSYFSWAPWSLHDADDGRYANSGTSGGGLPQPTYPNGEQDGLVAVGDCTKGWIFFEVPKGTKITEVRYASPRDTSVTGKWLVK